MLHARALLGTVTKPSKRVTAANHNNKVGSSILWPPRPQGNFLCRTQSTLTKRRFFSTLSLLTVVSGFCFIELCLIWKFQSPETCSKKKPEKFLKTTFEKIFVPLHSQTSKKTAKLPYTYGFDRNPKENVRSFCFFYVVCICLNLKKFHRL